MQLMRFAASLLFILFSINVYATPPLNLSVAKYQVRQYYRSGEYENDIRRLMVDAENYLLQRLDESSKAAAQRKLAIVLDIDETCLSNFLSYDKADFGHTAKAISDSFKEAKAPAIRPVLDFYNLAVKNNISVFFITRRPDKFRNETIRNLQNEGFYGWKNLIMPTSKQFKLPAQQFKTSARKRLHQEGYQIVLNIGDQDSDLKGGYSERIIKLPNPLYGPVTH